MRIWSCKTNWNYRLKLISSQGRVKLNSNWNQGNLKPMKIMGRICCILTSTTTQHWCSQWTISLIKQATSPNTHNLACSHNLPNNLKMLLILSRQLTDLKGLCRLRNLLYRRGWVLDWAKSWLSIKTTIHKQTDLNQRNSQGTPYLLSTDTNLKITSRPS